MPDVPPGPRPPQSLLVNALFGLLVLVGTAALLEGAGRLWERLTPKPVIAAYLWKWDEKWDGEFYTVTAAGTGWPPDEEFNAEGVRDVPHAPEKPEGTWRVAFLGDSVTLGAGVAPHEAYPRVLQARLDAEGRRVEVLNVSLWGWSTRQQKLAYRRIARRYAPDEVVVAVCLNDVPELQNNLARPPAWLALLHRRSALVRTVVNAQGREIQDVEQLFTDAASRRVREAWERFFAELGEIQADVEKDGARLHLLVFPFRFQVRPGAPPPVAQERIAAWCAERKLECLDMLPALRPLGDAGFVDYDHLSAAGTTRTAEEIVARGLLRLPPTATERLGARPPRPDLLRDDDAGVATAAAWFLTREPAPDALDDLVDAGRDPRESVRAAALDALGALGSDARPAVPLLLEALGDPRQAVRWSAARALHAVGVTRSEIPALTARLDSTDAYVRAFAAWQIGRLGPGAQEAAPALVAALRAEPGVAPGRAAHALRNVPAAVRQAIAEIVPGLQDPDPARRRAAVVALGKVGPAAEEAVPAMAALLADPHPDVREHAALALGHVGERAAAAVPSLVVALADTSAGVRVATARTLGRIGPAAATSVEALRTALRDREATVRAQAARALGYVGPAGKAATPDLERASRDGDLDVARQAAKALRRLKRV